MQELPITPKQLAELIKLARTEPGKQLLELLQKEKGRKLKSALDRQDYGEARSLVEDFLRNPEVAQLLQQLGRQ